MKEKVLEILDNMGFRVEEIDNTTYEFSYEGISYLFIPSDEDKSFLNIMIPCIYEMDSEESNRIGHELTEIINRKQKYVKSYCIKDQVWIFYEREILEGDDLEQDIQMMIMELEVAFNASRRMTKELEAPDIEDNEHTDDDTQL